MKAIVILRGVSGSGKSTVASLIGGDICCADDYWGEEYNFDPNKLKFAHEYCRYQFDSLLNKSDKIIIANTNTSEWEWEYYVNKGKANGYSIFFLVVENRHDGISIHNVPTNVIEKQKRNLMKSIKLN